MQAVLAGLESAAARDSSSDLVAVLLDVQFRVSKSTFDGDRDDDVRCSVTRLWEFFVRQMQIGSPFLQATIRRTARIITSRLFCSYPALIAGLLKLTDDADPMSAPLVIEVFTDIAARIDVAFRADFLSGTDVVQCFVQKAEQVYECVPAAIARLPNLGIEWHAELLAAYLAPAVVPPQYRAVYAIVAAFPDLMPNLFADGRDLTLIAFLLSSLDGPKKKWNLWEK
jgi:hypothetical protein